MAKFNVKDLRKRIAALRSAVDQGEHDGEELTISEFVFGDEGALEDIDQQWPQLHNALCRLDEDYAKTVEANDHLACSMDAVEAIARLIERGDIKPDESEGDEAGEDADDGDPDAGLAAERN